MDEMKMEDARRRLERLLDEEVMDHYDLAYYPAEDVYWEVVRPLGDELFPGLAERDLRAWVEDWRARHVRVPDPRLGDCFIVAAHLGTGYPDPGVKPLEGHDDDEVHIVHGLPVGRGDLNGGRRFWHAWVEVTRRIPITDDYPPEFREAWGDECALRWAVDRSRGQDLTLPLEAYYKLGQLDEDHVWRFTPEEARERMCELGHYGPWVDGWQSMEEV